MNILEIGLEITFSNFVVHLGGKKMKKFPFIAELGQNGISV